MKKILPLSQKIIAKIAAGEVIERPVYAVKELVENSLDAHADSINIVLEEAGLKKIIVSDNGEGMSTQDIKEAFKLHTTSKISSEDHLNNIQTLGFRGEALASIAAVSNLTIQSKTKQQAAGTKIELMSGEVKNVTPVGMPTGAIVTVTNLFHTVPARKKFLKSIRTEFRLSVDLLTQFAVANPHVHFVLKHNKKIIFDLPKTSNTLERIKLLLGTTIFTHLLPISYQDTVISISGFLVKPQATTSFTNKQFLFVNKRSVTDKLLNLTVKNAYGTLIESKAQPIFILFLTSPFEFVDVNVHPRKEQVRFVNHKLLYDTVAQAVRETLHKNNLTFYDEQAFGIPLADSPKITSSFAGRLLKESQIPWDIRSRNEIGSFSEIVQLHNLYLLTQTRFGMMLVDQHAAHERILFEQFSDAFKNEEKNTPQYHFPKPQQIDVSLNEKILLEEYSGFLKNSGIEIEHFKDNTFLVYAVPLLFQDRNPQSLIMELLSDLSESGKTKNIDIMSKKLIAYLACRGAIKAGESLTKKQAKELLDKLEQTNNNATCPHGRPTKIIIDIDQLHKMFKRK